MVQVAARASKTVVFSVVLFENYEKHLVFYVFKLRCWGFWPAWGFFGLPSHGLVGGGLGSSSGRLLCTAGRGFCTADGSLQARRPVGGGPGARRGGSWFTSPEGGPGHAFAPKWCKKLTFLHRAAKKLSKRVRFLTFWPRKEKGGLNKTRRSKKVLKSLWFLMFFPRSWNLPGPGGGASVENHMFFCLVF